MPSVEPHIPRWLIRSSGRGWLFIATWMVLFLSLTSILSLCLAQGGGARPLIVFTIAMSSAPALAMIAVHAARLLLPLVLSKATTRPTIVIDDPLVVVPVILRGERDIEPLRQCVLANLPHVGRLPMALLIDLADADSAVMPQDAALLARLRTCLTHQIAGGDVVAFVRQRRYDLVDRVWRGWERKRGKLEQFCQWLCGDKAGDFPGTPPPAFRDLDALLTIDVDSRLNAATLRGVRQIVDPEVAIVAPTIEVTRGADATLFERLHVPWLWTRPFNPRPTFNQSYLNQDLFHGKGLILINRFLDRTRGRIPERTTLSHDLVEATLAGAVSTTVASVSEPTPPTRAQWGRRQSRWIRGDFQNLRWVVARDLPAVMRFYLLEVAVAHVVSLGSLIATATALIAMPWPCSSWIVLVQLALLHPPLPLVPLTMAIAFFEEEGPSSARYRRAGGTLVIGITAMILAIVYAPHNALLAARASILVSWRLGWSGRNLLAWDDATMLVQDDRTIGNTIAIVLGCTVAILGVVVCTGALQCALSLLASWLIAPAMLNRTRTRPALDGSSQ